MCVSNKGERMSLTCDYSDHDVIQLPVKGERKGNGVRRVSDCLAVLRQPQPGPWGVVDPRLLTRSSLLSTESQVRGVLIKGASKKPDAREIPSNPQRWPHLRP